MRHLILTSMFTLFKKWNYKVQDNFSYCQATPLHKFTMDFFSSDILNISFKKQTILKSSCAPPLCRRWSERWGRMPSLREMQLWWWLRTSQEGMSLSQLTWGCSKVAWACREFLSQVTSSIPFGLTTSEDMWRERKFSQFPSCVEHKRQTKRKQGKRILKQTMWT